MIYRIRNWSDNYERSDTRKAVKMTWVPVPTKHDGLAFRRIMSQPDGVSIYGAWHLMLQVAAKAEIRGELSHGGVGLTPEDLALITGAPKEVFEKSIQVLASQEIAWLEAVKSPTSSGQSPTFAGCHPDTSGQSPDAPGRRPDEPGDHPATPGDHPATPGDHPATPGDHREVQNRTEQNRTEQDSTEQERGARAHEVASGEIPTLNELLTYGDMHSVTKETCQKFFTYHEGNNLWTNKHGLLINWRAKLSGWAAEDRQPNSGANRNVKDGQPAKSWDGNSRNEVIEIKKF